MQSVPTTLEDVCCLQLRALTFAQAKVDPEGKPGFFAIASPPDINNQGVLELLVKRQPGSAAEAICDLKEGSELRVSPVMVGIQCLTEKS